MLFILLMNGCTEERGCTFNTTFDHQIMIMELRCTHRSSAAGVPGSRACSNSSFMARVSLTTSVVFGVEHCPCKRAVVGEMHHVEDSTCQSKPSVLPLVPHIQFMLSTVFVLKVTLEEQSGLKFCIKKDDVFPLRVYTGTVLDAFSDLSPQGVKGAYRERWKICVP
eukprot:Gb_33535 [translate_table: standard]